MDFENMEEAERVRIIRAAHEELESLFVQDTTTGKAALHDTWVKNPNAEER